MSQKYSDNDGISIGHHPGKNVTSGYEPFKWGGPENCVCVGFYAGELLLEEKI